jgi:hypothetical protein
MPSLRIDTFGQSLRLQGIYGHVLIDSDVYDRSTVVPRLSYMSGPSHPRDPSRCILLEGSVQGCLETSL